MDTVATAENRIEQIVKSPHLLTRMFQDFFHSEATGSIPCSPGPAIENGF